MPWLAERTVVTVTETWHVEPSGPLRGDIEVRGVYDAVALELDPHPVIPRTRECQIELNLGPAVGDERVRVDQVD